MNRKTLNYLILFGLAIYSLIFFLGVWRGAARFEFLESDLANSTSMIVARMSPELFAGDALLSDLSRSDFYYVIQGPLLKALTYWTGDVGTAAVYLVGPMVLLQLLGFFFLGRWLTGSPLWGLLISLFTSQYWPFNLGEYWGLYTDFLPRGLYQAILPFVILLAFYWRGTPKYWPLIMALLGFMMFVHPVSGPAGGFAVWLSFWACLPKDWSWIKSFSWMFLCGLVFLLAGFPFFANYLVHTAPSVVSDYDTIFRIMEQRFIRGFMDIPLGLSGYFSLMLGFPSYYLGLFVLVLLALRDRKRGIGLQLATMTIGFFFVSTIVPLVEHGLAKHYRVIPPEVDLIRNLRYTIPLAQIALFYWLYRVAHKTSFKPLTYGCLVVAVILGLKHMPPPGDPVAVTLSSWASGKFVPSLSEEDRVTNEYLEAVRRSVPEKAKVYVAGGVDELAVRYAAKRPVVYSYKDGGSFIYSDRVKLLEWADQTKEFKAAYPTPNPLLSHARLANKLGAEYMIVSFDLRDPKVKRGPDGAPVETVYQKYVNLPDKKQKRMTILKLYPEGSDHPLGPDPKLAFSTPAL